jgi:hypothetical protein
MSKQDLEKRLKQFREFQDKKDRVDLETAEELISRGYIRPEKKGDKRYKWTTEGVATFNRAIEYEGTMNRLPEPIKTVYSWFIKI